MGRPKGEERKPLQLRVLPKTRKFVMMRGAEYDVTPGRIIDALASRPDAVQAILQDVFGRDDDDEAED